MRTHRIYPALAVGMILSLPGVVGARPLPTGHQRGAIHRTAATFDNAAHMDANNLDMVVTNHGSFAYDLITGNAGLVYPKGTDKTAVFAGGAWMGALVNGEIRVAVAEFGQEFRPGPMIGGTFVPDQPDFKTYKIVRGNTTSPDYLNWPLFQGAPLGQDGKPLLLGDVTMWSVYNDADPSVHTAEPGTTDPLGVEIQQTTFAFNRSGPLGNAIYLRFKLVNKGGNTLDDAYFSLWSDPDLGGFTDDLVGCDTTLGLGYCYNATNADAVYGSQPPAVGYCLLRGPAVPISPGVFDNLGMVSFNKYINGTDPVSRVETYNYMRGLQPDGAAIHINDDPNLPVTTFQVSGDPVAGTGWLDSTPADRRLMLSSGPFHMNPGDVQEIAYAIIIGQGTDRLSSITALRQAVPTVRAHADGGVPSFLSAVVEISPNTINLKSHAPSVTAFIEPAGFSLTDIDVSTVRLAGTVAADPKFATVGDHNGNGTSDLMVKFSRAALNPSLHVGLNELQVSGSLVTGLQFVGSDEVRVIDPTGGSPSAAIAPNPLNPAGVLTFRTGKSGPVSIKLFDLHGGLVKTVIDRQPFGPGTHEVAFDAVGAGGRRLTSGVYFFRVESSEGSSTGRVTVVK